MTTATTAAHAMPVSAEFAMPALPALPAIWHESLSLGAHVRVCAAARGPTFAMRCVGERLHDLLSPRFFTTVFAATAFTALLAGCA